MKSLPTELAFLQLGPGQVAIGEGPFSSVAEPPESRNAFYWNDFDLSNERPWKIPTSFTIATDLGPWVPHDEPLIRWSPPPKAPFAEAFEAVSQAFINGGKLEKLVPVITERGRLEGGDLRSLARHAFDRSGPRAQSYGHWDATSGFIGTTPEQFLRLLDGKLETMALAGTSAPREAERFREDPKQIREHALVIQGIRDVLLGPVSEAPREVLHLDGVLHFLTRLSQDLSGEIDLNALIRRLHPTPAVGYFPRSDKVSALHRSIRAQLVPPPSFAAPFGCWYDGKFESVVAIRQLSWEGDDIYLPSGCGLIRESDSELEWGELALKRRVVKQSLGL